ncbi:hypothetical protein [Flavobacterium sp. H122]|uniref:hypothetical protein n=1 Tax=Flavobacterium sp. H122 TaxID=2529860 RepID=UPI0010AB434B|nr:hypothetical protein [Flavobacterium sp. H122]
MDRLKHTTILLVSLVVQQFCIAQNIVSLNKINELDRQINETTFISTNKTTFISGETILFKVYCLNKTNFSNSGLSKIVYIELVNSDKESLVKQKIFMKDGIGFGDFFIPGNLKTGAYKLIAYTNWMLNFKNDYSQSDITIINPYQTNSKYINNTVENKKDSIFSKNNFINNADESNIEINKQNFTNREEVKLKINFKNNNLKKGNYNISVYKKDNLDSNNAPFFQKDKIISEEKAINQKSIEELSLPEIRGEIIQGRIIPKNSNATLENKNVSLSIPGKSFAFKITKTNNKGQFSFILDNVYQNPNISVQLIDEDANDYRLEILPQKKFDYSQIHFQSSIQLNESLKEAIEKRSIASQIENAYFSVKQDSIIPSSQPGPFYGFFSKEYLLDNFTRFRTLKETILEIVPKMFVKQSNNKYGIYLDDYNQGDELPVPTLVLVDGLYIEDIDELFEYNPKNIEKINVIYGGYEYGTKFFNGVVFFTTKNNDYESKSKYDFLIKPEILRPVLNKKYYSPIYKDSVLLKHIPDFRNQLLWLTEVNNTDAEVSFYTSDISGIFEIVLQGFSSDGEPVSLKKTFEVN